MLATTSLARNAKSASKESISDASEIITALFRYLLRLPDGEPPDPAMLVTAVPNWSVGDVITVGRNNQLRVVAIDDFPHAELVEHDLRSIFTVEPVGR